jgi:hypothetical protein
MKLLDWVVFLKAPLGLKRKKDPRPEGAEARHKNADKISKNYLTKREFKNTTIGHRSPKRNITCWLKCNILLRRPPHTLKTITEHPKKSLKVALLPLWLKDDL